MLARQILLYLLESTCFPGGHCENEVRNQDSYPLNAHFTQLHVRTLFKTICGLCVLILVKEKESFMTLFLFNTLSSCGTALFARQAGHLRIRRETRVVIWKWCFL